MADGQQRSVASRFRRAVACCRLAAAAGDQLVSAAEMPVQVDNVSVKTPDGMCDAAFIHPTTGSHPAVIIWPDAFGLRPAMRRHGQAHRRRWLLRARPRTRTIALTKAPGIEMARFNFQNQADMAKLRPLMGSHQRARRRREGRAAFIAFLDAQKQVDKAKKIGTQGYCMGGPLVMQDRGRRADARRRRRDRSTAAAWSPISRPARTCWPRKSRRACTSASPPTTTSASRMRRTS